MESHSLLSHSMSESYIFVQLANTKTLRSTNSNYEIYFTIFLLDRKILYSKSKCFPNIFSNFSLLCFVTAIGRCSSNIMAEETMEMVYLFLHNIKGKRKAFHIK